MIGGQAAVVHGLLFPLLQGAFRQGFHHLRRASQNHGKGRDHGVLGDQSARTHHGPLADDGAVHDDGAHADEGIVLHPAGVEYDPVAYGHVVPHHRGEAALQAAAPAGVLVDEGPVLDAGVLADDHVVDIAPDHRVVPNGRPCADLHPAHDHGAGAKQHVRFDLGRNALIGIDRHRCSFWTLLEDVPDAALLFGGRGGLAAKGRVLLQERALLV